jgi:hypothetical protein
MSSLAEGERVEESIVDTSLLNSKQFSGVRV